MNTKICICDLHTHSTFSDGTLTPTQLIKEAEKASLSSVALCDHNTIDGISEFLNAAQNSTVEAVPGVELTCVYGEKEVHVVGLFLQENEIEKLSKYLQTYKFLKEESNICLARKLNQAGLKVDYDAIKKKADGAFINRLHFANELLENGYVSSRKEAFDTILQPNGEFYVPAKRFDAFEAIEFLRSISAVAVLAHPFLNLSYDELLEFLPKAKESGLIAMETNYSLFDKATTKLAQELAQQFSLLCSGGSDFHGDNKPDIKLGMGKGDLYVPQSYCDALKDIFKK